MPLVIWALHLCRQGGYSDGKATAEFAAVTTAANPMQRRGVIANQEKQTDLRD